MQNKPNLPDAQMNITSVKTMNYEQITMNNANKNKPKQTQPVVSLPAVPVLSLPKGARSNRRTYFRNVQMAVNLVKTRNYSNEQRTMNNELLFKSNPISEKPSMLDTRFSIWKFD